jgi:hypothetical protein
MTTLADAKLGDRVRIWVRDGKVLQSKDYPIPSIEATLVGIGFEADMSNKPTCLLAWKEGEDTGGVESKGSSYWCIPYKQAIGKIVVGAFPDRGEFVHRQSVPLSAECVIVGAKKKTGTKSLIGLGLGLLVGAAISAAGKQTNARVANSIEPEETETTEENSDEKSV